MKRVTVYRVHERSFGDFVMAEAEATRRPGGGWRLVERADVHFLCRVTVSAMYGVAETKTEALRLYRAHAERRLAATVRMYNDAKRKLDGFDKWARPVAIRGAS